MAISITITLGTTGVDITGINVLESATIGGTYTAVTGESNVSPASFPRLVSNINDASKFIKLTTVGVCDEEQTMAITNIPVVAAWSAGGNMNTARFGMGVAGSATFTLAFGGNVQNCVEEYNGTSWSNESAMTRPVSFAASFGAQSSAISVGGQSGASLTNYTSAWNGTAWSTCQVYPSLIMQFAATGTEPAGLAFGGSGFPTNTQNRCSNEWNGSAWSAGGDLNVCRTTHAGTGFQFSALAIAGIESGVGIINCTEQYDGASWSVGNNLNTGRNNLAAAGSTNDTLATGGVENLTVPSVYLTCTEFYNGTAWSTKGPLTTARNYLGSALGTGGANIAFGGFTGAASLNCTEVYNGD